MKFPIIAAVLFMTPHLVGGPEAALPSSSSPAVRAPRVWLGLGVEKPHVTIAAQVRGLQQGVGFIVKSIDPGGPAELAGLREDDLLETLGDQKLINEAQLATLLRLEKPGSEVVLGYFRGGERFEAKVKLAEAPLVQPPMIHEMVEAAILPSALDGPLRVVNVAEKSANYTAADGRVRLARDGEAYHVIIHDTAGKLIFEGDFPAKDVNFEKAPQDWRRRLVALRRGLDQTLQGGVAPSRQPRPRVVPPAN
jgi:hypothetical protein